MSKYATDGTWVYRPDNNVVGYGNQVMCDELNGLQSQLSAMQARAERAEKLYELAWAECEKWRIAKVLNAISLIDAPILRAKRDHDTARSEAGRETNG